MCGIAGIVHLNGKPVDQTQLDRCTDALSHRGPDARGTFIDGSVGLGHRRLSIIDLTPGGAQPMQSEDGALVLTFNGEIYNFAEKRTMLEARGHHFRSKSDTEVLLKLYEEFGADCLSHLRGMFAFAIFDTKRKLIFLARDRAGKKPLYYFQDAEVFAFASEIKSLRTLSQCPRGVDEQSIHHFLTMMYIPSPATGFLSLHKLPAAHSLTLDLTTGKTDVRRYWELRYEEDIDTTLIEWKEKIGAAFEESVRLRMVADVPVGAFLSGGIDSAAVVSVMSRLSNKPVKTFSIGSSDPAFNELPQAAITAKAFGTDHHPIVLTPDIVHLLPALVQTYEEPYADPSAIPTYLVARETRQHVTVALNGDGGDENFAGYKRYPILLFSEKWRQMPRAVHAVVCGGTSLFHTLANNTLSYRCKRFEDSIALPWEQRYLQYLSFFTEREKHAVYADGFAAKFPPTDEWYALRTASARARAQDKLHQAMGMDLMTYLPDDLMPKVDRGTMVHALEARSPFLDHHLLELTARLPARYKIHGSVTKWMLKEMMKQTLPTEILAKRKTGFRLPLDRWFRSDLKEFVRDRILDAPAGFYTIFNRSALEDFLQKYHASRIDYSDHLWALVWLSEWFSQYNP
ncbi:asparagine synthase (glutamine-hydrolyzing) [Candidatus Peregrinibacteria bacterium]|nr:asparagine synthase (glutamine-hydrolyzing) [Candidatus Peregrinibacteria bacterium]